MTAFHWSGWLVLLSCFVTGCGSAPPRVVPERPVGNAGSAAIAAFDANQDGSLDAKELEKAPGLKAALAQADSDQDGKLSAAEISQRISVWANSRVGRMSIPCAVLRNGLPLANAEVRLVPEAFLGTALKPATGTTNSQGIATPNSPAADGKAEGIAPGFYRVEISTTDGAAIPAAFNTDTTLGVEIAPDAAALMSGPLKFEIP